MVLTYTAGIWFPFEVALLSEHLSGLISVLFIPTRNQKCSLERIE